MASIEYHLKEFEVGQSGADSRKCLPSVGPVARRILDVGCGAGQTLACMNAAPGRWQVGVDLDLDALRVGKSMLREASFAKARGEALPFKPAHFDLVIARVSLPYMDINAALTELHRVLQPGGSLWVTLHPFRMIWHELAASVIRPKPRAILFRSFIIANGLLFALTGHQCRFPFGKRSCETFQTTGAIRRALLKAGFEAIAIERGPHFVVTARKAP